MLSGIPPEIASYNISIVVTDPVGEYVETSFLLKIEGESNNGFGDILDIYTIAIISITIFILLILFFTMFWCCW
jgi:hypothetical protein